MSSEAPYSPTRTGPAHGHPQRPPHRIAFAAEQTAASSGLRFTSELDPSPRRRRQTASPLLRSDPPSPSAPTCIGSVSFMVGGVGQEGHRRTPVDYKTTAPHAGGLIQSLVSCVWTRGQCDGKNLHSGPVRRRGAACCATRRRLGSGVLARA